MSEQTAVPLRRIVISVDHDQLTDSTLNYAVALAAHLQRHLHGRFIEDSELIRSAELPFSSEICLTTGQSRALGSRLLASRLRQMSEHFHQRLAQRAEQQAVSWSVSVERRLRHDLSPAEETQPETDYWIFERAAGSTPTGISSRVAHKKSAELNLLIIDGAADRFYSALEPLLPDGANVTLSLWLAEADDGDKTAIATALAQQLPAGTAIKTVPIEALQPLLQYPPVRFDYVVLNRSHWAPPLASQLVRLNCPIIVVG